ncbi:hypothetical protein C8Q75DRAFT_809813 [Abortiporus biennis]|nr:hypothetical protein C8Q75DRAFT_809813 [Abortiporus biennis]
MKQSSKFFSPHLPQEIIDIIIDHIHLDTTALLTCSVTCRSWLPTARFHLFRQIRLKLGVQGRYRTKSDREEGDDDEAIDARDGILHSFAQYLTSTPSTAIYIRTLRIEDNKSFNHTSENRESFILYPLMLGTIMEKLPSLEALYLRGVLLDATESISTSPLFRFFSLKFLHIHGVSIIESGDFDKPLGHSLLYILDLFHRVESISTYDLEIYLSKSGQILSIYDDFVGIKAGQDMPSHHLHVNTLRQFYNTTDLLPSLLVQTAISNDTLVHFKLENMSRGCTEIPSELISRQSTSLSSLSLDLERLSRLMASNDFGLDELNLSQCCNLSSVSVQVCVTPSRNDRSPNTQSIQTAHTFTNLLSILPRNISHIKLVVRVPPYGFSVNSGSTTPAILHLCEDWPSSELDDAFSRLPNLQKFYITYETNCSGVDESAQTEAFKRIFGLLRSLEGKLDTPIRRR